MAKTKAQWQDYIRSLMLGLISNMDVDYGPVVDFSINPLADVASIIDAEIDRLSSILDLDNYANMTDEEFASTMKNFILVSLMGQQAIGSAYFQAQDFSSDVVIPQGTPISTSDNNRIIFYTTVQVTMYIASKAAYFNTSSGMYEIAAPIKCSTIGEIGMVAPGAINNLLRSISQVTSVTNRNATSLGINAETRQQSIRRYKAYLKSVGMISTVDGILVKGLEFVQDLKVIGAREAGFDRADKDSGAVDMYFLGQQLSQVSDNFRVGYYYLEDLPNDRVWIFVDQPVEEIVSVLVGLDDITSHFALYKDTGIYSGSIRAKDSLQVDDPIWLRNNYLGQMATVTYKANGLVSTMQNQFDSPGYYVFGRDLLVREATQVGVYLKITLAIFPGYDLGTLKATVQNNLIAYINALNLGVNLDVADVIYVVKSVAGVDNVTLSDMRRLTEATGTVHDLDALSSEYFRVDPATGVIVG